MSEQPNLHLPLGVVSFRRDSAFHVGPFYVEIQLEELKSLYEAKKSYLLIEIPKAKLLADKENKNPLVGTKSRHAQVDLERELTRTDEAIHWLKTMRGSCY